MIISYVLVALVNRPQAMQIAEVGRTGQARKVRLGLRSA
jgi:hypothetical protein